MPVVYQKHINHSTKLAIWHITEDEIFFSEKKVFVQGEIFHPHKRLQHLAGRLLLKELQPDFPLEYILLADTRKPFLENEAFHFSISHCGNYAATIVSNNERVGIDIEKITFKAEKVKHKFLSMQEQEMIKSFSMFNTEYITLAWSIKEAIYKWVGDGALDFIKHICIDNIAVKDTSGTAHCRILKSTSIEIPIQFVFFENYSLAWVAGNFTENKI